MKLKFLGTAAFEGIPAMFCACETCKKALKKGGRNIMTRTQALIDDDLLIDLNHDSYIHFVNMGKTLSDIEYLLITHSHEDHFCCETNATRFNNIAYNMKAEKLKVYLTKEAFSVMEKVTAARENNIERRNNRFEYIFLEPFSPVKIGDYTVTPLPAVHMKSEQALIYLIEKDGKSIFYGTDTGVFSEEIDKYLQKNGKRIDLLILDCTKCDIERDYYTHMSMSEGKSIADRFYKRNLLKDNAKLIYTHFSHNGQATYDDLVVAAKKYGFDVAYDGLEINL